MEATRSSGLSPPTRREVGCARHVVHIPPLQAISGYLRPPGAAKSSPGAAAPAPSAAKGSEAANDKSAAPAQLAAQQVGQGAGQIWLAVCGHLGSPTDGRAAYHGARGAIRTHTYTRRSGSPPPPPLPTLSTQAAASKPKPKRTAAAAATGSESAIDMAADKVAAAKVGKADSGRATSVCGGKNNKGREGAWGGFLE